VTAGPLDQALLPDTARVESGRLSIAGCDVVGLTERFGTPLFIYDEQHLIDRCLESVHAFPDGVAYASKAFLCKAMARIAHDAGMDIDVATGGEMYVALAAGVPAGRLVFHGNNKSTSELRMALEAGVGRIVVDSFDEMDRIEALVGPGMSPPDVLIRLNPGIEAHTHEYLQTGVEDSKFGLPLADGIAEAGIARARRSPAMRFIGVHAHVGSQVFDIESFASAVRALAPVVIESDSEEFSIGGGLGVAYVEGEASGSITEWGDTVRRVASTAGMRARITAEPGRAVVAGAAVTAYTIGTIKQIPDVRTYVSVDGGMSDNPRPVLYGRGYEATLAEQADAARSLDVRIVGKHCESGDVIVRNASLPIDVEVGDVLVTPVTGAYGHSMGSNYNKVLRPPVVFAREGDARVVVEREIYSDLVVRDVG
jgi:diaminopimelate decarboxylase